MTTKLAEPCPLCLDALMEGYIRREAVQPLQGGALDSLSTDRRPQCRDCQMAGTLVKLGYDSSWSRMRTAMSNFRQESMRIPGMPIGHAIDGARISEVGEMEKHWAWLDAVLPDEDEEPDYG